MSTATCPACRATIEVPARTRDGTVQCGGCGHAFTPLEADPAAPPAPAPEPPRQYPVVPFTTPGGGPAFGLGVAALFGLVAALVLGVGAAFLRTALWLVIVFPILHGILVGVFAGLGARVTKARYRTALALVAGACGAFSYFVVHYVFYLAAVGAPGAPVIGFWDFMDLRATEGVRIGKVGAGANGGGIGYVGSVIYWLVELVLTAGGAAGVSLACIASPFCEGCNRWKTKRQIGPYAVEPSYAVPAVGAGVPTGLLVPADGKATVVVELHVCPTCLDQGTIDVKATGSRREGKQVMNWNAFVTYPGEALGVFVAVERTLKESGLGGKK